MNLFIFVSNPFRRWLAGWALISLVPVLVFLAATEALLRLAVVPYDQRTAALSLFRMGQTTDAAFGDSQMMSTITGIPGMLNLAFGGENLAITEYRIQRYFKNRKPGRVILQATPNMFSDERERATESSWTRDYIDALKGDGRQVLLALSPYHRMYLREYWLTFITKGRFRDQGLRIEDGAYFSSRTAAVLEKPEVFRKQIVARVQQQRPRKAWMDTLSYRYFIAILDYLAQRDASVCLVTTPFPPAYQLEAARYPEFMDVRRQFDELATRYGFARLDLWDAVQKDAGFFDTDHLLYEFAQRISRRTIHDCFS